VVSCATRALSQHGGPSDAITSRATPSECLRGVRLACAHRAFVPEQA